jgi:hypothetical protein
MHSSTQQDVAMALKGNYRISRPIRRTFPPEKCDLNLTCVLCAEVIISKLIISVHLLIVV